MSDSFWASMPMPQGYAAPQSAALGMDPFANFVPQSGNYNQNMASASANNAATTNYAQNLWARTTGNLTQDPAYYARQGAAYMGAIGPAAAPGTYSPGSGLSSFSGTPLGGGSSVFDTGTSPVPYPSAVSSWSGQMGLLDNLRFGRFSTPSAGYTPPAPSGGGSFTFSDPTLSNPPSQGYTPPMSYSPPSPGYNPDRFMGASSPFEDYGYSPPQMASASPPSQPAGMDWAGAQSSMRDRLSQLLAGRGGSVTGGGSASAAFGGESYHPQNTPAAPADNFNDRFTFDTSPLPNYSPPTTPSAPTPSFNDRWGRTPFTAGGGYKLPDLITNGGYPQQPAAPAYEPPAAPNVADMPRNFDSQFGALPSYDPNSFANRFAAGGFFQPGTPSQWYTGRQYPAAPMPSNYYNPRSYPGAPSQDTLEPGDYFPSPQASSSASGGPVMASDQPSSYDTFQQYPFIPAWQASIPSRFNSPQLRDAISQHSSALGVPPESMTAVGSLESNGTWNPQTQDPGNPNYGIFQMARPDFTSGPGGRLGGLTWDQYRSASPAQQVGAYAGYLQNSPNAPYLDAGAGDPALSAGILQAMQFSPMGTGWSDAFSRGNTSSPVTSAPQARELGNTSLDAMTQAFRNRISNMPSTQLFNTYYPTQMPYQ